MNKWVSVALCICGLGLGGMMLTNNSDGGRALIENAPYITDGKINPAYEGKVVIVAGKLKTEKPAVDEELDISFDSPVVKRDVHVMVEKGSGSNIKRNWESTSASNIPQKYKRDPPPVITFYGVVKAGDFVLDKTLLEKFAAGVNVKELPQQASYKKTPLYHETESGIHYLTNREQNLVFPHLDGDYRISYTKSSLEENQEKTLVGIQKGNKLLGEGTVDGIEFFGQEWNGILTREKILKNNDNFDFILTVLGYALSVALIAGGIYSFKKS